MTYLTKRIFSIAVISVLLVTPSVQAESSALDGVPSAVTLFKNVQVFNGKDDMLQDVDVLVVGNLIKRIGKDVPSSGTYELDVDTTTYKEIEVGSGPGDTTGYTVRVVDEGGEMETKQVPVTVIDGEGRTLMPGMIDSHMHFAGYTPFNIQARQNVNEFMVGGLSMVRGESMLMRGFTTVRDLGGPSTYLRKLFDPGLAPGPRVYGAEQMITQTGGHGDFRGLTNVNPNLEGGPMHWYERHLAIIADGPDEFTRAAREAFRNGADFFKVFVSGGVSSEFDPIHAMQSTPEELAAVVKIANQNQTYVTAHCQTAAGAHHAMDAGVRMLEHVPMIGNSPDEIEEAAKRIKETGTWIQFNNGAVLGRPPEVLKKTMSAASFEKALMAIDSIDLAVKTFAKYQVSFVLGTDAVAPWGQASLAADVGAWKAEFETALKYYDNLSVLQSVTLNGGLVASMTGPNNPYPKGDIGVIAEGAYADILLIDGNPLNDPMILMDAEQNMPFIMKDGQIYKNTM